MPPIEAATVDSTIVDRSPPSRLRNRRRRWRGCCYSITSYRLPSGQTLPPAVAAAAIAQSSTMHVLPRSAVAAPRGATVARATQRLPWGKTVPPAATVDDATATAHFLSHFPVAAAVGAAAASASQLILWGEAVPLTAVAASTTAPTAHFPSDRPSSLPRNHRSR